MRWHVFLGFGIYVLSILLAPLSMDCQRPGADGQWLYQPVDAGQGRYQDVIVATPRACSGESGKLSEAVVVEYRGWKVLSAGTKLIDRRWGENQVGGNAGSAV